jgi:hypothetical protein
MNHRMRLAIVGIWLCLAPGAKSDGGAVRFHDEMGPYLVTVMTAPTPLRAGMVDVSVSVQDAQSRVHQLEAEVTLRAEDPSRGIRLPAVPANREHSINKLLFGGFLEVPLEGNWTIFVTIDGPAGMANCQISVVVSSPVPPWTRVWVWIAWPIAGCGLVVWNRWLKWSRKTRAAAQKV